MGPFPLPPWTRLSTSRCVPLHAHCAQLGHSSYPVGMVALGPAIVAVVHHVAQPFPLLTLELNVPTHHSQQLYKSTHTSLPPSHIQLLSNSQLRLPPQFSHSRNSSHQVFLVPRILSSSELGCCFCCRSRWPSLLVPATCLWELLPVW